MGKNTLTPAVPFSTPYSIEPEEIGMRAVDLPCMTSVKISELFPELAPAIPLTDESIRQATENALAGVDLSRVQPGDSVNILASSHGFTIAGGAPYAQVLRSIRDEICRRTGAEDIRLRAGNGLRYRESEVAIERFGLDKYFGGKARNLTPLEQGVAIDTKAGTLYGLKGAYDAKWIINVHFTDLRELHFHRMIDRIYKPFAMAYARAEIRSAYHYCMGPRGANFIGKAIYESDYVQEKMLCNVLLQTSPSGIIGVDADADLEKMNVRATKEVLEQFGKLIILLNELEEVGCVTILDAPAPIPYTSTSNLIFASFLQMGIDPFDLDVPVTPYSFYAESSYNARGEIDMNHVPPVSKALRAMINNYACKGYPADFFAARVPSVIVGEKLKQVYDFDVESPSYSKNSLMASDLEHAVGIVERMTGCNYLVAFDGAVGGLNVSESMREFLMERAPIIRKKVDEEYMPKWLRQRGMA